MEARNKDRTKAATGQTAAAIEKAECAGCNAASDRLLFDQAK
jgi:hypothetical protein